MKKWLKSDPMWDDHIAEVRAFAKGGLPGMAMLLRVKPSMMLEWKLKDSQWARLLWDAGLRESSCFGLARITSLASKQESLGSDDPSDWSGECAGGLGQTFPVSQISKKHAHMRK